jgi:hypothetical protein
MKTQIIRVKKNTTLKDLKVGDLVMTGELAVVRKINGRKWIKVTSIKPQCSCCKSRKCGHEYIKSVGWGQQSVLKVISK